MNFNKTKLCDLKNCYAVNDITKDGVRYYVFATDDLGQCYAINANTLEKEVIWEEPGGTMSIVPLEGRNGEFLVTVYFYPGFKALHTEIRHVFYKDGKWQNQLWMKIPYLHRFDLLRSGDKQYLICGVFSTTEKEVADWNYPGNVLVAEVDKNFSPPDKLEKIADNMPINHGYFKVERSGYEEGYMACKNGVYTITPPHDNNLTWEVEKILDGNMSEIAVCDIDGDGNEEIATIQPFHGDQFVIYKKINNKYEEIYRNDKKLGFLHALWGGKLRNKPVFLVGGRSEDKDFFMITYENGELVNTSIEEGFGPSNLKVLSGDSQDIILVANREANEAALFTVEDKVNQ